MCVSSHVCSYVCVCAYPPLEKFLKSVTVFSLSCTAATFSCLLELVVTKEKAESWMEVKGTQSLYEAQEWPTDRLPDLQNMQKL